MKLLLSPSLAITIAAAAATAVAFLPFHPITAFPNGAGACPADIPAVGTPHVNSKLTITTGTIEEAGFEFLLDGTILVDGDVVDAVNDGLPEHSVDLVAASGVFRGFLIRAQSLMGDDLLMEAGSNAQEAAVCLSPAVGVTHTSKDAKTDAGGTIVTNTTESTVVFDITIVVELDNGISEYFYSQYTVNFASNDTAPIASPVSSPVAAPVASPVATPTEAPADATVPTPAVITTTPPTASDDANTPPAPAPAVPTSNEVGAPTDAPTNAAVAVAIGGNVLGGVMSTVAACLVASVMMV